VRTNTKTRMFVYLPCLVWSG